MVTRLIVAWAIAFAAVATGCQTKRRSCHDLVEAINGHQGSIHDARKQLAPGNQEARTRFGHAVEGAEHSLAALEFNDPQLRSYARDYRKVLADARNVAERLTEPKAAAEAEAIADAAHGVATRERDLISKINSYCAEN